SRSRSPTRRGWGRRSERAAARSRLDARRRRRRLRARLLDEASLATELVEELMREGGVADGERAHDAIELDPQALAIVAHLPAEPHDGSGEAAEVVAAAHAGTALEVARAEALDRALQHARRTGHPVGQDEDERHHGRQHEADEDAVPDPREVRGLLAADV